MSSREAETFAEALEKLVIAKRMNTIREWLLGSVQGGIAIKVQLANGKHVEARGASVALAVDALIAELVKTTRGSG